MGSVVLTMFSISMLIFQLSCKKEANAQTTTTGLTQLNLVVYTKLNKTSTPLLSEIWTSNLDGTSQKKVALSLPTGMQVGDEARLTPDGKTIVFTVQVGSPSTNTFIYTCSIDGSNLKKIVDNSAIHQGMETTQFW